MSKSTLFKTSALAVFAALLSTTASSADVTPEQVWSAWQQQAATVGYSLRAAQQAREGDTLVVTGVVMEIDTELQKGAAEIGEIRLRDLGNGTVDVQMPPSYTASFTVDDPTIGAYESSISYAWEDLRIVVSGTPEVMRHDLSASEIVFETIEPDDDDATEAPVVINATANAVSGHYTTYGAAQIDRYDYDLQVGEAMIDVSVIDLTGSETYMELLAEQFAVKGAGTLRPGMLDPTGYAALVGEGLTLEFEATMAKHSMLIETYSDDGETQAQLFGQSGRLDLGLSADGIVYRVNSNDLTMALGGDSMPFPIEGISLREFTTGLTIPVGPGDRPSPFGLNLRFVDLALPDMLWGMLDPAGALPREPAVIIVDLEGTATMTANLFDPESMDAPPGLLETLAVKALQLKAAGAELTGSGSFSFDNTDMESFDGFPRPEGVIEFNLSGADALLEKLQVMGIVDQEDVMGFRMGSAMFARPGAGPDTLTSEIEVTPDGAVLANGQRIR